MVLFSHGFEAGRDPQFGKSGARKTIGRVSVNFDATDVNCNGVRILGEKVSVAVLGCGDCGRACTQRRSGGSSFAHG